MRKVDERTADATSITREGMKTMSKEIRVAVPGIVEEWDPEQQTVSVKCAIKERLMLNGESQEKEIPMLVDVPVCFPSAGGYSLLCVPEPGDECLVIFADMCMDGWWQSSGVQSQIGNRRHDLSDGFAIMGCWSQPNKKENYPEKGCMLAADDGTTSITLDDGKILIFGDEINMEAGNINMTASAINAICSTYHVDAGTVSITAGNIGLNGGVTNVNGTFMINGKDWKEHTHSGVESGGSSTGTAEF